MTLAGGKRKVRDATQAPTAQHQHEVPVAALSDDIDVRQIRDKLGMSQAQFAQCYGFSLRTVQDWEQRRRIPSGITRTYLSVIIREPDAVRRALAAPLEA